MARQFPDHTTYLMAYRGYGASDGQPSQRDLSADAVALVDHVTERHSGARIDVIGRSLGSGVAVHVATQRTVEHLVLVTPFDSLAATASDLFPGLPVARLIEDHWDSAAVAAHVRAPTLVVRAGRDAIVRPERTDVLIGRCRARRSSRSPTPTTTTSRTTFATGLRLRRSWRGRSRTTAGHDRAPAGTSTAGCGAASSSVRWVGWVECGWCRSVASVVVAVRARPLEDSGRDHAVAPGGVGLEPVVGAAQGGEVRVVVGPGWGRLRRGVVVVLDDVVDVAAPRRSGAPREHAGAVAQTTCSRIRSGMS